MGKTYLTLYWIMSQNGHTHFKNLVANAATFFKVCLAILTHYVLEEKDLSNINNTSLCRDSPSGIYLFKLNNRNTRKGVRYVQS